MSKLGFSLISWLIVATTLGQRVTLISKTEQSIGIKADSIKSNKEAEKLIEPFRKSLETEMNMVLVFSDIPIEKGLPESTLGNLVADVCLKRSPIKADFALLNNGGLRTALPIGPITKGKVFELMPFDNEIVVVTLTSEKMEELFKYISSSGGVPISGLTGELANETIKDVKINGQEFTKEKSYKVATTDYLANNGDKMTFFSNPIKLETTRYRLRDALIDEFSELGKKGERLNPKIEGRLK